MLRKLALGIGLALAVSGGLAGPSLAAPPPDSDAPYIVQTVCYYTANWYVCDSYWSDGSITRTRQQWT